MENGIKSHGISDIIWLVVTTVLAVQFIGFIVNKGRLLFLSMTGGGSSPLVRADDQPEDAVEDLTVVTTVSIVGDRWWFVASGTS